MADVPGSIHEIDSLITQFQQHRAISSPSHPLRLFSVLGMAITRLKQHMLSDQREDLEKSIFHFTESILLPPHLWSEHGPLILKTLFYFASALYRRSQMSKQPQDAIFAAKCLHHLLNQPLDAFEVPRRLVTILLVDALAFQVGFEAGNVMQNIGEMAVLCRELLTSDMSNGDTTRPIALFVGAVLSKIRPRVPDQPLTQVIECLRVLPLARTHKPELRVAHCALAVCLSNRYLMTFVNDDYEEAVSILDEIIASSSPGDIQDQFVVELQQLVTGIAVIRSTMHKTPEYSEEAMYRSRVFLGSSPEKHTFFKRSLEDLAKQRFQHFGSIEGVEASSGDLPLSHPVSVGEHRGGDPELGWILEKQELLRGLRSGIRNNDTKKIDEAIKKGRTILASAPRHLFAICLFDSFGEVLFEAFKRTNKIEYLDESISTLRQAFERPFIQYLRFEILERLSLALFARSISFPGHNTQDVDEGLELLSKCADDVHGSLVDRFRFACRWAAFARRLRHRSVSKAYESAMSSMQDTLFLALTLQLQQGALATTLATTNNALRMPLDYASLQVDLHQLEQAVEVLERGRALLWSEMRHLRASIDQLLEADPQLGHKFSAVNRDLEELTKSIPPSHKLSMDDGGADNLRAVDPFGRLLVKQRGLLKVRNGLISQIHALPGFDDFLASPSFDTLRSAASSGPVIIINHSTWRSDILILFHHTSPSLIPTSKDFFGRASALKEELLDARKDGPDSEHYNQTLAHVLTELYKLVGEPVIHRLRQLKVPEQSRVWWCPTSVFCSLPLHAMGPIPSDNGKERYFLDIYISSYTPTLSALIPASDHREPGSPTGGLPSLLLVAHFDLLSPDESLSEVCGDIKVVQALNTRLPVKSFISEGATTTSALDGLQDHQFVHFICHGTLEARKPLDAGFELHGNERLTLLDIVRAHLPSAEFAFLSACHTAELTEGSSADEGLHLAAAVQYCGFRSVVGTMWAMAHEDGPELTKHFYKSMFLRREQEEPVLYYKRSAGALRDAVKKLRKKRGITLERWVNFVHYGA